MYPQRRLDHRRRLIPHEGLPRALGLHLIHGARKEEVWRLAALSKEALHLQPEGKLQRDAKRQVEAERATESHEHVTERDLAGTAGS